MQFAWINQQAKSALPANVPQSAEFNRHIGIDVKYINGLGPNNKVSCVNIVDYGTSMQVVVPLFQRETAEVLKSVVRDNWIAWAGVPSHITVDPAQTNLGEVFVDYCESNGITFHQTAADAHWQLGKVERHGQWFARIFDRVCDEVRPKNTQELIDCIVQAQTAKNSLISQSGVSPNQLVFGRNPRVPQDVSQEEPHVVASDAVESSTAYGRNHEIRQAARRAVPACQDDKALRAALRARPRATINFQSGDWVFYWRTQKWQNGVLERGGKWHGAAMVLGSIGRNIVVAHRQRIIRCAPEQLRMACPEEREVAEFPESVLLGTKNLLEKGQFPKSQFIDIVGQEQPPGPDRPVQGLGDLSEGAKTAAEQLQPRPEPSPQREAESSQHAQVEPDSEMTNPDAESKSNYGPVRRRYTGKQEQDVYSRPPAMKHEDFVEMMNEIVPKLVSGSASSSAVAAGADSPRGGSQKREASTEASGHVDTKPKVIPDENPDEELFCQEILTACPENIPTVEVLMSAFLQKRMQKELPASGNPPELQSRNWWSKDHRMDHSQRQTSS